MPRSTINFEEFTDAALAAATKALTANPRLFPHPEITIGIVIRRNIHIEQVDLGQGPGKQL